MLTATLSASQKMSRPSNDMVTSPGSPRASASALLIGAGIADTRVLKTAHAMPSSAIASRKTAFRRRKVNLTMGLSSRRCAADLRRSRNFKGGCAALNHNVAHDPNVHLQGVLELGGDL